MNEAFVYRWTNIDTGMIYIGYHKGTIDDGYVSSGQRFLQAYNEAPELFQREILHFGTKQECLQVEGRLISEAIQQLGYHQLYNNTCWQHMRQHHLKCLYCSSLCDPRNVEWLRLFERSHFNNCSDKPKESPAI